ncbi:MAG: hypothetical protein ABII00_19135 [Elusimicrobiota bacterium]
MSFRGGGCERGLALVQVLVMSVLLVILATGVLKVIFADHVLVARVKNSDVHKYYVEACMARKNSEWDGQPCRPPNSPCVFSSPGGGSVSVSAVCSGNTAVFEVNWQ